MTSSDSAARLDADAFARLALELHDADGFDETVETVVQFALQAENCSYAGVALATTGGGVEIGAVTDPLVEAIYAAQIDAADGPMLQALNSGTTVYVADVAKETRWPRWLSEVAAGKVRSVLHVPMKAGDKVIGGLSLYTLHPDAFTADDEAIAHILARYASVAVATARHEDTMARAVDARKLVGLAMGILMERFDLDGDQAFAVLRRYSQDTNTKLRDVAQHLIETRKLPHLTPDRVTTGLSDR
ncbi:GAF and ANTAR domain-containing protein [Kribbella sp. NPDC051718]|uniref:GAF and ANTAR domain-containing protein n=1 Tax=Kribbella sp. NPDC051718 TaxID=3155168 RepID=UPI003437EB75